MKAKILVAEVPFAASLIDVLDDILRDEAVCEEHDCSCFTPKSRVERKPIFEAPTFSEPTTTCGCRHTPINGWGIAGKPADENKVFGACYKIDEPCIESYAFGDEWKFESDKEAFDRFVDAGEDCMARGMGKKTDAPIHKVNAIRKRIEDGPVFGVDLIGESHIWR